MIETLFVIDLYLCVISMVALAFFCAVVPRTDIAQYLYLLFGITLLPIGIKFIIDGKAWYEYIWIFLLSVVGIILGTMLIIVNKKISEDEKDKIDKHFGRVARDGGKRRLFRQFWITKK